MLGIALLCLILGVWAGLAAGLTHAVLYVFVLAPLINGLGHWRGDQNFSGNTAYNWRAVAWVTGGEGPAQQSSRVPERAEVQHAAVRVRSLVGVIRALAAVRLLEIVGTPVGLDEKDDAAQRRATTKEASTR